MLPPFIKISYYKVASYLTRYPYMAVETAIIVSNKNDFRKVIALAPLNGLHILPVIIDKDNQFKIINQTSGR